MDGANTGDVLNDHDVQTVRLMLMMYRQGWLDASEHLQAATMRNAREMHRLYKELCDGE